MLARTRRGAVAAARPRRPVNVNSRKGVQIIASWGIAFHLLASVNRRRCTVRRGAVWGVVRHGGQPY
eukprot:4969378-Prymnesium_polylepis.1